MGQPSHPTTRRRRVEAPVDRRFRVLLHLSGPESDWSHRLLAAAGQPGRGCLQSDSEAPTGRPERGPDEPEHSDLQRANLRPGPADHQLFDDDRAQPPACDAEGAGPCAAGVTPNGIGATPSHQGPIREPMPRAGHRPGEWLGFVRDQRAAASGTTAASAATASAAGTSAASPRQLRPLRPTPGLHWPPLFCPGTGPSRTGGRHFCRCCPCGGLRRAGRHRLSPVVAVGRRWMKKFVLFVGLCVAECLLLGGLSGFIGPATAATANDTRAAPSPRPRPSPGTSSPAARRPWPTPGQ